MADTTFVSKVTKLVVAWLQDINNFYYRHTGFTSKTTPVDADTSYLWDSVTGAWETLSWANLKTALAAACSAEWNAETATTAAACSGNAATATTLATPRLLNGRSFNGSADVNHPGLPFYAVATAQTVNQQPESGDLNLCISAGDYNFNATSTNQPAGITGWGFLRVGRHAVSTSGQVYVHQTAYDMNGTNIAAVYVRRGVPLTDFTCTWSAWKRVMDEEYGTFTGAVSGLTGEFGTATNSVHSEGRTDGPTGTTNYARIGGIYATNPIPGAAIGFIAEGTAGQLGEIGLYTKSIADDTTQPVLRGRITQNGSFVPEADNVSSLGTAALKFSEVNAVLGAFTGAVTLSQTAGIVGTTTNNNANAGSVGEYVAGFSSSAAMTNGVNVNAASISLTAGDWDVSATGYFIPTSTTNVSQILVGISTVSATIQANRYITFSQAASVPVNSIALATHLIRLSLSATTTVYLIQRGSFTASTMDTGAASEGGIFARRVR